jgi:hypothetical protein
MPFTAIAFNTGAAPGMDGPTMNFLETQYIESILSFGPDLFTPWVLTGLVATKDGTTFSQLDVTAGTAYPKQTDNTLRQRTPTATNFSTTGHVSTTMYLDLNPDGTWSWNTAHSGVANYLPIAQVTTDSSANILAVTDERTLNTTFLPGMAGVLNLIARGAHNGIAGFTISAGNGAPASLAANEIYIQLS